MEKMTPVEPQSANDYDGRTTAAVKSVLIEMGQILGSYKGKYAIVGGAVPWLLLDQRSDMRHVGTLDVDLGLDAQALGDGEYAHLIESLMAHGYGQRENLKRFQLARQIHPPDNGLPIDVIVDFLMPKDAVIVKNKPQLIDDFAVQRASGAELALRFNELVTIAGAMPNGGSNRVEVAVCSIPALLAMKGHAIEGRYKQKDAYDIYYCIRNYPDGIGALAEACRPLLDHQGGIDGYRFISGKFDSPEGFGPTCVRQFVQESQVLEDRTPDQWQLDAFGQVDAWLRAMGLRD
jgi:hypothetical protein